MSLLQVSGSLLGRTAGEKGKMVAGRCFPKGGGSVSIASFKEKKLAPADRSGKVMV